jgi:hypothetical protein
MTSWGIPGTASHKMEAKRCGCCKKPTVFIDHDSASSRVLACHSCDALEVITKGEGLRPSKIATSGFTTPTWW